MSHLTTINSFICSILVFVLIGCNSDSKQEMSTTTVVIDSTRNIELTIPDSMAAEGLDDAKIVISDYFNASARYYIDTISTLSATSLALKSKAQKLREKLITVLPKISLTTGIGENKFTRDYYIIEGDIKVDRDELLLYCKKRLQQVDTSITDKINSRKLTVAADRNGKASIWPPGTLIKYCIQRTSFSSKTLYDNVVKTMHEATRDWMKICNIRFEYLSNLDKKNIDVETYPEPILFVVRQINVNGDFLAQSFFPNDPSYERMLLIDNTFFTSPFNKTGVLRHELGHILGFRHEHIWSDDASCSGENVIEEELHAHSITKYDPYSVMHYPCGLNKDNRLIDLTDFDREGARKVYPYTK